MPPADLAVLLIVTFAAFVRATVGFGDALIAMSLLVLVVSLEVATPLVGLTGVSTAVFMLLLSWQKVDVRSIAPFLGASAIGIPLGALLLTRFSGDVLIVGLGVVLVSFGLFKLTQPALPALRHPALTFGLGVLSGIFGGAYNVSGPVAVLYGGLRQWPPEVFRASLQGYFIVTSLLIATSHGVTGLWSAQVWRLYAFAVPLTAVAIFAGHKVAKRVPQKGLERLINLAIIALGVTLIF